MDATVLSYRGRTISPADVAFIRDLIRSHPEASRRRLSQKLCEAWGWVQANGALRDAVCRGLLLERVLSASVRRPRARLRRSAWSAREAWVEAPGQKSAFGCAGISRSPWGGYSARQPAPA